MVTHSSVLLPGESHGQRSLAGYHPWGHRELDVTEALHNNNIKYSAGMAPGRLPWCSRREDFTFQCKGRESDPWSGS